MNRHEFVFVFDVKQANPNGDPDAGNLPRIDPETGHGLVTDVCLKRKVRNYVATVKGGEQGFRIYFTEKAVLNQLHKEAYEALSVPLTGKKEAKSKVHELTKFMCENFWDIRTFGAVMTLKVNCGQVRGPVQMSFASSVDPIVTLEHTITRSSVASEDEDKERTMGRKYTVPYAVYVAHGMVNPFLAEQTGFSDSDLELLWEALTNAFAFDSSAARPPGSMNSRKLVVFRHDSKLGAAPSHVLFDSVRIARKDETRPARSFDDYAVTIDESAIPAGVEVIKGV